MKFIMRTFACVKCPVKYYFQKGAFFQYKEFIDGVVKPFIHWQNTNDANYWRNKCPWSTVYQSDSKFFCSCSRKWKSITARAPSGAQIQHFGLSRRPKNGISNEKFSGKRDVHVQVADDYHPHRSLESVGEVFFAFDLHNFVWRHVHCPNERSNGYEIEW